MYQPYIENATPLSDKNTLKKKDFAHPTVSCLLHLVANYCAREVYFVVLSSA